MDWKELPYDHAGKWKSDQDSIMNPGKKCSLPMWIMEKIIDNRAKYIPKFTKLIKGDGWSRPIARQVKLLCQQAFVILNYLPHPSNDPLVTVAVKKYFTDNRVFKLGGFRKTRVTKSGKCNITQEEKYLAQALIHEFDLLKKKTDKPIVSLDVKPPPKPQIAIHPKEISKPKSNLLKLMEIEKGLQ